MLIYLQLNINGYEGEGFINVLSESRRSVQADERQMNAVAPEPTGRKRFASVEPVRECCVSA